MHARKAAGVLPEPVGAQIRVLVPRWMCGQSAALGLRRLAGAHEPFADNRVRPIERTRGRLVRFFDVHMEQPSESRCPQQSVPNRLQQ
jgi:hypothetical protein